METFKSESLEDFTGIGGNFKSESVETFGRIMHLIKEKSYSFAIEIVALYKTLLKQNEYVLSKQVLKAGTSIGANVEEALAGQSRADFLAKMSIASKEARETNYWLRLLRDSEIIAKTEIDPLLAEAEAITNILTAIVKTTQNSKN